MVGEDEEPLALSPHGARLTAMDDFALERGSSGAPPGEPAIKPPPEPRPDVWQSLPRF